MNRSTFRSLAAVDVRVRLALVFGFGLAFVAPVLTVGVGSRWTPHVVAVAFLGGFVATYALIGWLLTDQGRSHSN